ncbi:AAA family ATPase, partial [Streptomyces sp. NPDC046805]|uniref:AAA family ATPase n=1 Tax=Streptomyces sp. NPDC046805 TaxID=3155134 RepID=UPI0033C6D4EF
LQVLDDGILTDAQGRTVNFRHCVIIMTSNIGAQLIIDHEGDVYEIKGELMDLLRGFFRPEFLNRIDDIIVFNGLTEQDLEKILDLLLAKTTTRLKAQGLDLEVTEPAKKLLIAHGYQPEFGARPLRRTIQTELDNRIASLLLGGEAEPGDTVIADVRNDSLHVIVRGKGKETPEKKAEAKKTGNSAEKTGSGAKKPRKTAKARTSDSDDEAANTNDDTH